MHQFQVHRQLQQTVGATVASSSEFFRRPMFLIVWLPADIQFQPVDVQLPKLFSAIAVPIRVFVLMTMSTGCQHQCMDWSIAKLVQRSSIIPNEECEKKKMRAKLKRESINNDQLLCINIFLSIYSRDECKCGNLQFAQIATRMWICRWYFCYRSKPFMQCGHSVFSLYWEK